jgi:hypothetical protein
MAQPIRRGEGTTVVLDGAPGLAPGDTLVDGGTVTLSPGDPGYADALAWLERYEAAVAEAVEADPTFNPHPGD